MVISPAYTAGLKGLNTSISGMAEAANQIATLNVTTTDANGVERVPGVESVAESIVDLKLYLNQGQASVRVIETVDEMVGSLLDEFA